MFRARGLFVAALLSLAVGPACKCGKPQIRQKLPQIDVNPPALVFQPLPVGRSAVAIVTVHNAGDQDLHLARDPWVASTSGVVEYTLPSMLDHDCGGNARDGADHKTIIPGDCARVVVRYAPVQGGTGVAQLNFQSDDPDHGQLGVPISLGLPAHLGICTVNDDGTDGACDSAAGAPPTLDFALVARGQTLAKKLRLKNTGKTRLEGLSIKQPAGSGEFTRGQEGPVAIDAGTSADLVVRFSPVSGGPRTSLLEIDSADPVRPVINVPLRGIAAGPALCPDPTPLEYGQGNVGARIDRQVTLTSCGSVAVQLQQIKLDVLSSAAFTTGALPAPQSLSPGQKVTLTVTWHPPDPGDFTGSLLIPNDGQPDQYVPLHGAAIVAPACSLSASVASVDFGQVVRGGSALRDISVANRGPVVCNLAHVVVPTGIAYFSVVSPPTVTIQLRPGDAFVTTVKYAPPASDANVSDSGTIEFDSDDPVHPQVTVALQGAAVATPQCKLQITPASVTLGPDFSARVLQFGNVVVGRTKTLPLVFRNVGSAACSLSNARLLNDQSLPIPPIIPVPGGCQSKDTCGEYHFVNQPPASLAPGQSAQVLVQFAPKDTAQIAFIPTTFLFVNTSDTFATECTWTPSADQSDGCVAAGLSGQGDISNLEVIPSDVDFGLVTLGCRAKQQTVTLYNTGNSTSFNINGITLDPTTAPYYIQAPPTPFAMKPGAKVPIQVTYKPTQAAVEPATLKIQTDAANTTSNNPYVTVSLKGTGTTDKHQRDTFNQAAVPKVDMLFVIDDSGSFDFYQQKLSEQAGNFITAALKYNADFRIGVSTNDVVQKDSSGASYNTTIYPGGLYGQPAPPGYVSNGTPDAIGQFSRNVRVGTGGTAQREAGLELAWDVLRPPYNQKPPPQGSQGFLRDDARLVIIDVQDDDDESNASTGFFIDYFKNLKGQFNAGLVSFNAIGAFDDQGQPNQCVSGSSEPGGARYLEVANGTGGKVWSLCSADWGAIADQLALGAFSGRKQFPLTRTADPATIVVTLNGAAQVSGTNYTYDQPSNSVVFAQVPAPGATIVVDYDALCL